MPYLHANEEICLELREMMRLHFPYEEMRYTGIKFNYRVHEHVI